MRYVSGIYLAPHYCVTTSWDTTVRLWTFDSSRPVQDEYVSDNTAVDQEPSADTQSLM
eukprot:EC715725.1.p4 GENE.EC715725.1~~EC715725.1.p4  ORF type:complete len:58 (+),score=10.66 EC715725.1:235-408(+)